jgi:putative transposase
MSSTRNRTSSEYIYQSLYLYFLGLSTRAVSKTLFFLNKVKRSHVAIWKWVQKYHPKKILSKRKRISEFIVDETLVKVGSDHNWLWIVIEPKNKKIPALSISKERNMLVAEWFLSRVVKIHGRHPLSTDGGTWYPMACRFLGLKHHLHSPFEKSLIERTIQYIKDRTECYDGYFLCRKENCKLEHVLSWLNLFVDHHNRR